jgi:hypothetical protein
MDKKIEEAREEFNSILDFVLKEALGLEIHEVEDRIYRRLLRLGRILLELFVLAIGTGKAAEALIGPDDSVYRYLRDSGRKYLSIFGEITIMRAYYARKGRKGLFPLDARLNLPARKYSYTLQDRMVSRAVETSYEKAAAWVNRHFYLESAHRPIQRLTRDCAAAVTEFMDSAPPPHVETEGPILVHTVDCKGIRMRPEERNPNAAQTKDKPGEKRMACVAQTYTIDPHYRSKEAITAGFFGPSGSKTDKVKDPRRPEPLNRRTFVSLKDKKSEVFLRSSLSAEQRIHGGTEEKLTLMDGEKALWKMSLEYFPGWTEALDLTHAVEKLRIAGEIHFGSGPAAEEYGRETMLCLLEGRVDEVIEDFETALEDGTLSSAKARELKSKALGYFRNNRDRMSYDRFLEKGLPIASGVIESACNSLVNIRMEGAGMFWSMDGAEAILELRGVFLDGIWDDFWEFRAKTEKKKLYGKYENIRAVSQQATQDRKAA